MAIAVAHLAVQVESKRSFSATQCVSVCRVVRADDDGVFAVGDAVEVVAEGAVLAKALKRGAHVLDAARVASAANDRGRRVATVVDYGGKYARGEAPRREVSPWWAAACACVGCFDDGACFDDDSDEWTGAVPRGLEWMVAPDDLPYATSTPGVGGRIKADPSHFVVEELLDRVPDGKVHRGSFHYWFEIRRAGLTTERCQRKLAAAFGPGQDAGDSTSLQRGCSRSNAREKSIHEVVKSWANVSPVSCPGSGCGASATSASAAARTRSPS